MKIGQCKKKLVLLFQLKVFVFDCYATSKKHIA